MNKEITFEEYQKASEFARFKFKYGLFVLICCLICEIIMIIFIILYANELKSNPLTYAADKFNVDCICKNKDLSVIYYVNDTTVIYKIEKEQKEPFNYSIDFNHINLSKS